MKKIIPLIILCALCLLFAVPEGNNDYFRIHIRANSNEQIDQDVKLQVRDAVTAYLAPMVCLAQTKAEAKDIIRNNLSGVEQTADAVLQAAGYDYRSKARTSRELFPTRVYGGLTLEEGVYDALIVDLGKAQGDNWWCVIYPPLCFVAEYDGTDEVYFKSKILEILSGLGQNSD